LNICNGCANAGIGAKIAGFSVIFELGAAFWRPNWVQDVSPIGRVVSSERVQ
jgi:hypothetical protein